MLQPDMDIPTWTAYPSLLGSLDKKEHHDVFEEAACAHYCGRFGDAVAIFDSRLPANHTIPVLTFQMADMLTTQGLEPERIDLLQRALFNADRTSVSTAEVALLKLMLADAEYWAVGKLNNAFLQAQSVQKWLRSRQLNNLSDIEVSNARPKFGGRDELILSQLRCITLYHQIIAACEEDSNKVLDRHKAIFLSSRKSKFKEFRDLRKTLESQRRLGWAYTMMRLELNAVPSPHRQQSMNDCSKLCEAMKIAGYSQNLFRSASLKMKLSGMLLETDPERFHCLKYEATHLFQIISPPEFQQWEAFLPTLAFELEAKGIEGSEDTMKNKCEKLKHLYIEQVTHTNYTTASQALISARGYATQWLLQSQGSSAQPAARQYLRQIQASLVEFHRTRSHLAYFEGHTLADYLSILDVEYHEYDSIMRASESFQQNHQDFEIPRLLERILNITVRATEKLGMHDELKKYERLYDNALMGCSFWQKTWGLTDAATLDPDFYFREIQGSTNDQVAWGNNAVKVMLMWSKHEWNTGVLNTESWKKLFGFAFDEVDEQSLELLDPQEEFMKVGKELFGPDESPSDTNLFLREIKHLQDWLLIRDRPPSRGARLFALKMILKSRVYRFGKFLAGNEDPPNSPDFLRYEKESRVMRDIEVLETGNNAEEPRVDKDKMMAIHTTLMQCYLHAAGQIKLVSDHQLAARISDAREVIEHFKNNGRRLSEYHAIVQMIRLSWQRHLLFSSVPADYCLEAVEAAEGVANSIRGDISITEAPRSLLAKIKLSDDFNFREHYNYALVATLKAYQDNHAAAMAAHSRGYATQAMFDKTGESYETFREWTYRSKGRGLTDILGHNSDITRAFAKHYPELSRPDSVLQNESDLVRAIETSPLDKQLQLKEDLKHLRETMRAIPEIKELMDFKDGVTISKAQIDVMLNEIDGDVVIVDFIHFAYQGSAGALKAILYRKNKLHFPLNIPDITLNTISHWVAENLDGQEMPLAGQSGTDKLQLLGKLIEPLIKTPRPLAIKPGETIIFCPTADMHRIPLHAIHIDGVPLIGRNPVLYCQSLTTLYHCFQLFRCRDKAVSNLLAVVINPMPDYYEDADSTKDPAPVTSSRTVANLANSLGGRLERGFNLKKEDAIDALKGTSIIHYHGHAWYSTASPLDSALLLNEAAYKSSLQADRSTISLTGTNLETLTARDIFGFDLTRPAFTVLIGCRSGVTKPTTTDDVLGLPTAFIYAGSSAVISTLWPIDDSDGALFEKYFYDELWRQKESLKEKIAASGDDQTSPFKNCISLAKAVQKAVNKLRKGENGEENLSIYHWAPFTLNGFWMFSASFFSGQPVSSDDLRTLPGDLKAKLGM